MTSSRETVEAMKNGRGDEERVLFHQAFRAYSEKRALLIDGVADSECRREADHTIGVDLKVIEATDIFAFQNALIAPIRLVPTDDIRESRMSSSASIVAVGDEEEIAGVAQYLGHAPHCSTCV